LKFLTVECVRRVELLTVVNFVEIGQTEAEIWRFFDFSRWRRPPSWILNFFEILTVGRLKRAELVRRAKFGRNPSNRFRYGDFSIYFFSKGGRVEAQGDQTILEVGSNKKLMVA